LKVLQLPEKRVRQLLAKRRLVQAKGIWLLEIRSCFIGSKRHSLHVLRRFFNAQIVGAPVEFSAFGHLDLTGAVGQAAYDQLCHDHTDARKYTEKADLVNGKVALAYKLPK